MPNFCPAFEKFFSLMSVTNVWRSSIRNLDKSMLLVLLKKLIDKRMLISDSRSLHPTLACHELSSLHRETGSTRGDSASLHVKRSSTRAHRSCRAISMLRSARCYEGKSFCRTRGKLQGAG